jgi:hypothetical protein
MKRATAVLISVAIAIAVVFGAMAVFRTTSLGAAAQRTSSATIAARSRALDRFELSLRRELRKTPPPLPATGSPPAAEPRVVYRRPAPILVIKHRHHDDDGQESERDD